MLGDADDIIVTSHMQRGVEQKTTEIATEGLVAQNLRIDKAIPYLEPGDEFLADLGEAVGEDMRMNATPNGCIWLARDLVTGTRPRTIPVTIPKMTQK